MVDEEAGFKKRIFRKVYTLSITAEIPATTLAGVGQVTQAAESTLQEVLTTDGLL